MKFDDFFVDRVRNSISIVDLIGGYVRLKKSGQNFSALCPFHSEKTPSFQVSESKQIFKCFGCGAGGDVFKFIMLIEHLSFPDSIRYLADRSGISLPQAPEPSAGQAVQRTRLLNIMETAASFFRACLQEGPAGAEARAYLREREISGDTSERFALGFAAPGSRLLNLLTEKGFQPEEIESCGLIKQGEQGGYYDKFRSRIIFPIRDLTGRTIAFGGRLLGEGGPKYLNSPETPLYNKSRHLYGLSETRDDIRRCDFAILVEGYFDCIVPYQFGFRNVVASLGTSLTENQVRTLSRYTRNVIVNFDPDSAGTAAAVRSIDLFLQQGMHVNIMHLPGGHDPDAFLRREGAEPYQSLLKESVPYLEFLLARFMADQRDPYSPKGKQEIVRNILPYLIKIPERIERSEYASRIAGRLRMDDRILLAEMRKMGGRQQALRLEKVAGLAEPTVAEKTLLAAIFEEKYQSRLLQQLTEEIVEGLVTEKIFRIILDWKNQSRPISILTIRQHLQEEDEKNLLERVAVAPAQNPLTEELLQNSIQALREKQFRRLSDAVQEEIRRAAQDPSRVGLLDDLLRKKEKLRKQIEPNFV